MLEYHVHTARSVQGTETELDKRTNEGWELMSLMPETSGWHAFFFGVLRTRFTLVFRREKEAAPQPTEG